MTEAEWLACDDPHPMLKFVLGKTSDRKSRLFACACCRRIWHLLDDDRSRKGIEAAEMFADGKLSDTELQDAWAQANAAYQYAYHDDPRCEWSAAEAAHCASHPQIRETVDGAVMYATWACGGRAANPQEPESQAALLRDLFGVLPFCTTLDAAWLTSDVLLLARGIYEEKAFDRLSILADALQDAGCDNDDILNHCRGDGPHVRGCWVVDLVLGKE